MYIKYKDININHSKYTIITIKYKKNIIPIVLDKIDADFIKKYNIVIECDGLCNIYGIVKNDKYRLIDIIKYRIQHVYKKLNTYSSTDSSSCSTTLSYTSSDSSDSSDLFDLSSTCDSTNDSLDEMLMNIDCSDSLIYINGLGLDNRRKNLKYSSNILFSKDLNMQLPCYISMIKGDMYHGIKFKVEVNNIKWFTTSSKKICNETKLELAKKYLLQFKSSNPNLFKNTELSKENINIKRKLLADFYIILEKAHYDNIKSLKINNIGNFIINYKIPKEEKKILKNIEKDRQINKYSLPKYVFYRSKYKNRGSFFAIENHPNSKSIWRSTSSKYISDKQKYEEVMNKLKILNKLTC